MTHSRSAQRIRRSALGTVVAALALSHAAPAQGRGRGGPPVGTFDVVWRPVRDATPNVIAIDVRETLRGAPMPDAFKTRSASSRSRPATIRQILVAFRATGIGAPIGRCAARS
jgi:hypothetical protein